MKYKKVSHGQVFEYMVDRSVTIDPYPKVFTIGRTAEYFKTSKYQAKKAIDKLCEQGFVKPVCENFIYSDDELGVILRGFRLTDKAMNTPYYKMMAKQESDRMDEVLSNGWAD